MSVLFICFLSIGVIANSIAVFLLARCIREIRKCLFVNFSDVRLSQDIISVLFKHGIDPSLIDKRFSSKS